MPWWAWMLAGGVTVAVGGFAAFVCWLAHVARSL